MQSSLLRIYSGKYSTFTSIFVSSVFFGALHFEFGFLYMCGAALLMGLFGIYYNKTRNIFATSIIHYAFTTSAMILGFIQ
jgi:membrane protease YdiL (CAAX protease family)